MKSRRLHLPLAAALSLAAATPALAGQSSPPPPPPGSYDARPEWPGANAMPAQGPDYNGAAWQQARADWLAECRRRQHGRGKTVGGAVLGGVVGGVIGNRVAGDGNRTVGTVVGAAAGAAVGGAIGSSADSREARDYCEAYLDQYMSQNAYGRYGAYGQGYVTGYAYQPMTVMVPVAMVAMGPAPVQQDRECKETIVTEEWVDAPVRRRYIAPRPAPRPAKIKRVRSVPDKRIRL